MVLLLAKNSKAGYFFRAIFLKQVVIEIQELENLRQKFSKYPPGIRPIFIFFYIFKTPKGNNRKKAQTPSQLNLSLAVFHESFVLLRVS